MPNKYDSFTDFIEGHLCPGDDFWGENEPELDSLRPGTWREKVEQYAQDFEAWEYILPDQYSGMMDAIKKYLTRNPPENTNDAIQKAAYFAWLLQQDEWSKEDEEDNDDDLQQFRF